MFRSILRENGKVLDVTVRLPGAVVGGVAKPFDEELVARFGFAQTVIQDFLHEEFLGVPGGYLSSRLSWIMVIWLEAINGHIKGGIVQNIFELIPVARNAVYNAWPEKFGA